MRILILSNDARGLFLFRRELVDSFIGSGHKVFVSVPYDEHYQKLKELGWSVTETEINRHGMNPIKDMGLFISYIRLIRKYSPDVILTYTIKPNIYGGMAALLTGTPYICNITGLGQAIEKGGILSKILILMYKAATLRARKVFFQNEKNMQVMQSKGVARKNADLLPGSGVNLTEHPFYEYPDESEGIRFLAVLRIMKDKGIGEYLRAAKKICASHKNVSFALAGYYEEDERQKYEPVIQKCEKRGILKYLGEIDNVQEVMAGSHIIVHPSYHEGMSNVLLEAASCGRPILTCDINGCKEAVVKDESGFLFEPESTEALVKAIERILSLDEQKRAEMGRAGRRHIEDKFDRNIIIDKYKKELEKL